jgi:hypothetical protein
LKLPKKPKRLLLLKEELLLAELQFRLLKMNPVFNLKLSST